MAKQRFKPINPGELNRAIVFQELTEGRGETSQPTEVWTDLVEVMARKVNQRGEERLEAGQVAASFDTMWQTYYREDIDPDLIDVTKKRRITYLGRVHDITRADVIEVGGMRQGLEFETIASGRV
jgi:SPP1 family predicted phage head-tail adaptor